MNNDTTTGGHAFPQHGWSKDPEVRKYMDDRGGMTLRDYFAAKELSKVNCVEVCDVQGAYDRLADHCYRMADAMLRAREAS
ncbi:hypothetical protein [Burkholderia multivorans]|uniref:hypothetical protein n=1 Tax=Burkholderia multivorans TaxID=87883 RepID=UPI0021BEC341|nr:hypothetical protein [Burkholderia multivorans]